MFSISGTHVYASAGPFTVRTAINDKGGTTDLLVGTAGGVAVTPSPISLRAGVGQGIGFDFGVAQFRSRLPCSDFNGPGYSATIDWGDGTSSHGGISNSGGCAGVFTLGDHHTYANGGIYSVVITIRGSDGSGGSAIGTATVTPLNGPVVNPVPVIGSMSPDHAAQNGGAFTLAISGNNFTSASLARWNGADLPTNVVSPSLLVVVVPPNDLATTTDLVSASLSVFTPAPGGGLSGALPFVISSARVKSANSAIAAAGASVTASTAPIVAGDAGVAVTFTNTATNAACVTVATYVANPTKAAVFDAGGGFVDVQVCGQPVSGSAFARFYYPSTVTGAAEAALSLLYFNGTAWSPVRGIGGAAPVLDTSDNLDATVSGGLFQVSFDATSTPALNALGGTVFTLSRVTDGATSTPTPTLTSTATATPTATATSTRTSTPTPTATSTSTPASTPTPTSSPAATSTPSPTPELVGGGPGDCDRLTCPPSPSATPELDSLLLFASGLLGIGGYGLRRIRSRRRVTRQGG